MASRSVLRSTPSYNTSFTYKFDDGLKPPTLMFKGDAHIPTDTTYLRLTKTDSSCSPLQHTYGRVIYREPVQLWLGAELADFETTVVFILKPKSGNNVPADGLVFFMVPVDHIFPSETDGGNLGIYGDPDNPQQVFAVEFDIFVNDEWDPNFPHVGINIGTRASKTVAQIPASFIGEEVTLNITYKAATQVISAVVTHGPLKFEISYVCDWIATGALPQLVQVGLAGSSGYFVAKHDVAYWDFKSILGKNGE